MEVGTLRTRGVSYLVDDAHPGDVASDMGVIAAELHCTAVMIISADPQRLEATARLALDQGLEVWARLDSTDLRPRAMLHRLADAAQRLEALRSGSRPAITLVVGSEFSHTVPGMVPGPRSFIRLKVVLRCRKILRRHIRRRLDALLRRATAVARESFRGQVTYSAAAWEDVDWALFDVVGVSLYRSAANHDHYRDCCAGYEMTTTARWSCRNSDAEHSAGPMRREPALSGSSTGSPTLPASATTHSATNPSRRTTSAS